MENVVEKPRRVFGPGMGYSQEFKDTAVSEYLNGTESAEVVAKKHNISRNALYLWINQFKNKINPETPKNLQERVAYLEGQVSILLVFLQQREDK